MELKLLPTLLKKAEIYMSVRICKAGSPYAVNFILQLPSGFSYHFVGHPDFTVNIKPEKYVLRFTLREVQSRPGQGEDSKTTGWDICRWAIWERMDWDFPPYRPS